MMLKNYIKMDEEEARIEYNNRQIRDDRKIKDYFTHISDSSKNDLAVEIIIELGNIEYWETKNINFKKKRTNVFKEQEITIDDLENENKNLSSKLQYFKDMFYNLVRLLIDKIFRIKDNKYKEFAKELYEHGTLDNKNYEDIIGISKSNNFKEFVSKEKDDFER